MAEFHFSTTYECEGGHDITVNDSYEAGGLHPCPFCDEEQVLTLVGQVLLYERMNPAHKDLTYQ